MGGRAHAGTAQRRSARRGDRGLRRGPAFVALVGLIAALAALGPAQPSGAASSITCTKTWAGGGSGVWDDLNVTNNLETQWSPQGVPIATDSVCLPAGSYTVTMLQGTDIMDLRIGTDAGGAQPTLALTGSPAPNDAAGLRVYGSVGVENNGTFSLGNTGLATNLSLNITPGVFKNAGTIDLIQGAGGSRGLFGNPSGTFVNTGTIHSASGAGFIGCTTVTSSGVIDVDAGATLDWGNCGQVHVDLTGGSVINDGLFDAHSSLDISGSTAITGANPVRVTSGPISFAGTPTGKVQVWSSSMAGTIPAGIEILVDNPAVSFNAGLSATGAITNNGTVTLNSADSGGASLSTPNATFTNNGTVQMLSGGGGFRSLDANPNGTFKNTSTGTLRSSSAAGSWGCATIESAGVIDVDAGAALDWGNCGQVHVSFTGGTVTNDGLIDAHSSFGVSGTTQMTGNPIRVSAGALTFGGTPTGRIQAWASTVSGTIPAGVEIIVDNPTESFNADLSASGPTTNNGTITLNSTDSGGATLRYSGTTFTNNGTVQMLSGGGGFRSTDGNPNGVLSNSSTGVFRSSSANGSWGCMTFVNDGVLDVDAGAALGSTCGGVTVTGQGGVIEVDGTLTATLNLSDGRLTGAGTVSGPVSSSGATVAPGNPHGTLTISGNYTQTGNGDVSFGYDGPDLATQRNQLVVTGTASLAGTLRVLPTAVPSPGVVLVQAGTLTGSPAIDQVPASWVTQSSTTATLLALATFADVPLTHPFFLDIEWGAAEDVVRGYPNGTFQPSATLTRQAVAAMFYRLAGSPNGATPTCSSAPFSDVPTTHAFCGEIAWAAGEGLVNGYSDGTFKPTGTATRQALAAMFYRLAGSPDGDDPTCSSAPFSDVPTSHAFCGEVDWAASNGIVTGYSDNTFRPTGSATRQAMAAFLHRAYVNDLIDI